MKKILVLGAGQSAPYMIHYLLKNAKEYDWFVTVGDRDIELARNAVKRHSRGEAIAFDINDDELRLDQINKADVVVNFLPPAFQYLLALGCVSKGKHMITASYQDDRLKDLVSEVHRKGILILNEMGLDPGIDHMSAMSIIGRIKSEGGVVKSFKSYGSALPAPESVTNPLKYAITWNARNVVIAGSVGAQYLYKGQIKILPYSEVFQRTWNLELEGVGRMEAYPNRDSLKYRSLFGLDQIETMIRGTLRYPGWSETWSRIVFLGLTNETMHIPNIQQYSYRDLVEMFLPLHQSAANLEQQIAYFLGISPTGAIMANLSWLGLLSDEPIVCSGDTAADVLVTLLKKKLQLPAGGRDMVALVHEIEAEIPGEEKRRKKITSTFIEYGETNGFTAIAKTVGLPAAIATKLLLNGKLPITGCHIPTHSTVYSQVLPELENEGMVFKEKEEIVEPGIAGTGEVSFPRTGSRSGTE
jgi:saccharopine dehydrogenase-like NADP-dependent oxidoreductase